MAASPSGGDSTGALWHAQALTVVLQRMQWDCHSVSERECIFTNEMCVMVLLGLFHSPVNWDNWDGLVKSSNPSKKTWQWMSTGNRCFKHKSGQLRQHCFASLSDIHEREQILKATEAVKAITYQGCKILIFPHLSSVRPAYWKMFVPFKQVYDEERVKAARLTYNVAWEI